MQTLELKQLLGNIVSSEGYFLSAKKYLLDKDELTFDDTLTVLITLLYCYCEGRLERSMAEYEALRFLEAIDLLTDSLLDKYLLKLPID